MPSVNEVWCISNRKLPLALAKISITPKMRREQPETSNKLELYQEKCADVLANVFLDIKLITSEQIFELTLDIQNLISQNKLLSSQNHSLEKKITRMENMIITLMPPTRHSEWKTKVGKKIRSLAEHLGIDSEDEIRSIYGDIYRIMRNDYDMDVDKFKGDYLIDHKEVVNPPAIDIVDEFSELKSLFESVIDNYIEIKSIKTNV